MCFGSMGAPDIRQRKLAPRASLVPAFALSRRRAGAHLKAVAVALHHRRAPRLSLPALLLRMKVLTSGTSTWLKAGLGLLTVRAHSQAMTVSC
jgi:hypothetical protein